MTKKLMIQSLTMVEHAAKDPRSFSAMLRGTGDGREQPWLAFENVNQRLKLSTKQRPILSTFLCT